MRPPTSTATSRAISTGPSSRVRREWPGMDDEVRTVLRQLVQSEGEGFYADPARVESRLRERVGDRPAQVDALVTAARAGVVEELQDVKPGLFDVAVGHLTGRMVRMHDADPDAARWAVESWAEALGAGPHPPPPIPSPVLGAEMHRNEAFLRQER